MPLGRAKGTVHMSDHIMVQAYELAGKSPAKWALTGLRLKDSADLLFNEYHAATLRLMHGENPVTITGLEHSVPASLLLAFAFENSIKGVLVSQGKLFLGGDRLMGLPKNAHDLLVLCEESGIDVDDREGDILRRLTAFGIWAGRYPIPLRRDDIAIEQIAFQDKFIPVPLQTDERGTADRLFQRITSMVVTRQD